MFLETELISGTVSDTGLQSMTAQQMRLILIFNEG